MAIDTRANVACNLGRLISASISDDYIQESGLIKTSGSCEIDGLITPSIGDIVTFSYTKNGITRNLPRKMRVLSSFADPFRRTTSISLGCKLTYLADLKDPINWDAFDDDLNANRTREEQVVVTIPIHASSIMNKCLLELGISASSNPLTNKFSIAEFDFSAGYVDIMSDLLVSESYFGYLDFNETLQVLPLDQQGGSGPVITSNEILDVGPINVGPLPGEAVTVSYSTLKLRQPEGGAPASSSKDEKRDSPGRYQAWGESVNTNEYIIAVGYDNIVTGEKGNKEFNITELSVELTTYKQIRDSEGKYKTVAEKRIKTESIDSPAVLGSMYTQLFNNNIEVLPARFGKTTTTNYTYDRDGNVILETSFTEGSEAYVWGGYNATVAFSPEDFLVKVGVLAIVPLGASEVTIQRNGNFSNTVTLTYTPWSETIWGQQAIAEANKNMQTSVDVAEYFNALPNHLVLTNVSTSAENSGYAGQEAPSAADITNERNAADSGDPNNGWRTEDKSELELALGDGDAQRRIEFSMPYAPDDTFVQQQGSFSFSQIGGIFSPIIDYNYFAFSYQAIPSDAPQKAKKYGIIQNKLLMGGRSGMNLQLLPEKLPTAPFEPLVIQVNNLAAMYRTNGTTWTMDANGIVASTDALFWGGIGVTP